MSGFLCSMVGATFAVAAAAEVIRLKNTIVAFNGAEHSIAQFKFGGSSAKFDGTDDYIRTFYNTNFTSDFTIECWARFNSIAADQTVWQFGDSNTDALQIYLYTTAGGDQYKMRLDVWGRVGAFSSSTINTNTWYHFATVRSGSTITLYINGTSSCSVTRSQTIGNGGDFYIGARQGNTFRFNGHIDELRISNTARYTSNFTAPSAPFVNDANTILLLHFDNRDGSNNFFDDNGIRNKIGIFANGNAQVDTAQSKFGGASALFDGTEDWLQLDNPIPSSGNFTVELWFRPSAIGTLRPIWSNRDTNGTHRGTLYINAAGGITWWNAGDNLNYGSNLSANTWYHIACVKDGSLRRLFINGDGVSATSSFTPGQVLEIGAAKYTSTAFSDEIIGHIDEFRISNIARYTANFTAPSAPFVNDENTLLLLHMDGTDAKVDVFEDDNGIRLQQGIIPNSNAQIDTAQSKFGGSSLLLDGSLDYLKIMPAAASDLAIGSGNFTIECWVRFANFTGGMIIDSRGSPQNGSGWCWYVGGSSTLRWYYNFGDRITSSSLSTNTWYHVAMVRSGNDHKMFINGTQTGSTYTASNTYVIGSSTFGVWIGENQPFQGGTGAITGHIDEFRISKIARYTANFTAPTAPFQNDEDTVLLLHFNDRDASTIFTDDNGVSPGYDYGS